MTDMTPQRRLLLVRALAFCALVLLALAYLSPAWWVSLKAPQYPEVAFPQGIRIHFHMDGVFNGCKKIEVAEKQEGEALNCKHEMDAINHFVGMYPIAAGGPVERVLSPFLFSLLGLMIVVFTLTGKRQRTLVATVGGVVLAVWMGLAMYGPGGHRYLSPNYVSDVVDTMALEPDEYETWSGVEMMREGYEEALGRYFRERDVIKTNVEIMSLATHIIIGLMLLWVVILALGVGRWKLIYWAAVLLPTLLPVFFVIDYAAWLWWFGHSLHEMGAFTLKPFMPTVLGQGKVAQFFTYSYPHYGYGLMALASLALGLAALLRRQHLRQTGGDG